MAVAIFFKVLQRLRSFCVFRLLHMDTSNPKRPLQPPVNAIAPQDNSTQENPEPPCGPTGTQLPPTNESKKPAEHCRPDQMPWWKHMMELAAILVGIAVAIIYYGQLQEMRTATDNANRAFRIEEQAQIAVTNLRWNFHEESGRHKIINQICTVDGVTHHICFLLAFKNEGKSPASDISITAHTLYPIPANVSEAREQIDKKFVLPPFSERQGLQPASSGDHEWGIPTVEKVCDSGPPCIPTADATAMVNLKAPLYIYGAIQYRDHFDGKHATRFCFFGPVGGTLDTCSFGNFMDRPDDIPKQ